MFIIFWISLYVVFDARHFRNALHLLFQGVRVFVGQGVSVTAGVGKDGVPEPPAGAGELVRDGAREVVPGAMVVCAGTITGWETSGWGVLVSAGEMAFV